MKQKQLPAFAVACGVLLIFSLSGCANTFMEWVMGGKSNEGGKNIAAEDPWTGPPGAGTAGDPFIVWNVETLLHVGTGIDGWTLDANYRQERHIDMAGVAFTPIGTGGNGFTGAYNGQGISGNNERRAILNLVIYNPGADYQGLFGYIDNPGMGAGTVINVTLINCSITGKNNVGGIAGQNQDGTVINSSFTGAIAGNRNNIGGIVGLNNGGTVDNCSSSGYVSSSDPSAEYAGGVAGNNNSGIVQYSHSSSIVTGKVSVGGVAGGNTANSMVTNCYSTGSVTGEDNVGGVVGWNNPNTALVENSYATGAIKGNLKVGGVVGHNNDGTIRSSYSKSNVTGTINNAGGIAGGSTGYIGNCYSTGAITSYITGGIVGEIESGCTVEMCYATGTITGSDYAGGIAGKLDSGGELTKCIALNRQINSPYPNGGRVVGDDTSGGATLIYNYAYEGILDKDGNTTTWPTNVSTGKDGGDVSKPDIGTVTPFTAIGLTSSPWTYTPGKLPILIGLSGQSNAMPDHLK